MPLISIITITYNAAQVISKTLESISVQTFQEFEYIIIDGNSKDDTLKVIAESNVTVDILISEPDQGIYDAMNKGLKQASGDYVWFMNAGDSFANPNILKLVSQEIYALAPDIIYGDANFVDLNGHIRGLRTELTPHKLKANLSWKDIKYGMLVCHQALVVKRSITEEYILDNLSADIDWEIMAFKKAKNSVFLNQPLCNYLEGGVSVQQHKRSLFDRYKVLQSHFGLIPNIINHLYIIWRGLKRKFF